MDISPSRARAIGEIFRALGIRATFFLRLHGIEYNPFSFENYLVVRSLIEAGHEIGYHSEIMDLETIWGEDPRTCLERDIRTMETMYGIKVKGVASHGGFTGINNLDFWRHHTPAEFGLLYEAYDTQPEFNLMQESFYVSDSEWFRWKCYDKGSLRQDDRRSPAEHARDHHPILYTLIHPECWYERHFYE